MHLLAENELRSTLVKLRMLLLALVVTLLGYAAWYREPPPSSFARVGFILVFDITQSMLVQDVRLDGRDASRLALAKRAARQAVESLPCGVSVGTGVFAQHRTLLLYSPVEVCANRSEVVRSIALIDTSMAWSGNSEVAKGYYASLAIARALPHRPALVFLTDGHEAPPINPRHRPAFDGEAGQVRAALVGVGGELPVPIPKRDPAGKPLGYWNADEVMQLDPYRTPRTASNAADMLIENENEAVTAEDLRAAGTPGTEHLSSLRGDYLQLLAAQTGASYRALRHEAQLTRAVNALLAIPSGAALASQRRLALVLALAAAAVFYCLGLLRRGSTRSAALDRMARAGTTDAGPGLRTLR